MKSMQICSHIPLLFLSVLLLYYILFYYYYYIRVFYLLRIRLLSYDLFFASITLRLFPVASMVAVYYSKATARYQRDAIHVLHAMTHFAMTQIYSSPTKYMLHVPDWNSVMYCFGEYLVEIEISLKL